MTQPSSPVTVYRSPDPRRFQAVWVAIAILALFPAVALMVLRLIPPMDDAGALFASFIPYGIVFELIAVIFAGIALVRARNRIVLAVLTGFAALLLIIQLIWIGPQFIADDRPATTSTFTLLSLNTLSGKADLDQLEQHAASADVLNLVEVTPPTYRKIKSRLADEFPYLTEEVQPKSSSSMVLSRFPLSEEKKLNSFLPQLSVAVDAPEIGQINLISAHPCNPYCTDGLWAEEHQQLLDRAESLPDRPTVIAGDFNAIPDHGPMRELEDHGFTSATDIVGAGWQPTFPANRWYPPIVQIDQVMVSSELTATRIDTFSVARTDHLGLLADLAGTR